MTDVFDLIPSRQDTLCNSNAWPITLVRPASVPTKGLNRMDQKTNRSLLFCVHNSPPSSQGVYISPTLLSPTGVERFTMTVPQLNPGGFEAT